MHDRQVHSLEEALPQRAADLIIRTALQGALRIAKVRLDVGRQTEALVIRHLLAEAAGPGLVGFRGNLRGGPINALIAVLVSMLGTLSGIT